MHSAASSASLWLAAVANLTEAQYCQVLRTDFAVAYARTISGVHYHSDNIAGLNMGQMVVSRKLARHLALTYGSDREVVKAKIRKMRFDWNTFDPETCTVQPKYK
jgi:homoserine kinase